jgi:cysteine sulfinate desulfinase/cysteine desulfurase-like protein
MTPQEHAERIKATLDAMEAAQKALHRATRKHHRALQAALEELGPAAGLSEGEIVAMGGGTNKSDDDDVDVGGG